MQKNHSELKPLNIAEYIFVFKQLYNFVIPKGNIEIPTRILIAIFFLILGTLVNILIPQ